MDHFAALFAHAAPSARAFFAANLCETAQFSPECGHLHLLKGGALTLAQAGSPDIALREPTLLFFPRGRAHRFTVDPTRGADLVCATVDLGGAEGNPIGEGLPELVVLPLAAHPALAPVCDLLIAEGFSQGDGRQVALDRLIDYLLILVVRHVVTSGAVEGGRWRVSPIPGSPRRSPPCTKRRASPGRWRILPMPRGCRARVSPRTSAAWSAARRSTT